MDKYIGKRLDGRYEIEEIIGVGGMAVVYKAYDNVEDRTVAIKILKDEFVSNDEFIRRFKNESKAIAILSHPNIVKVYDVSFGDLIQYIVMEYIDGITLKEFIERQGSLRWKDTVYFTIQILKALQHAHDKGIVHRDVKPQNIMVLQDGTIKVTDFGIARFARSEQRTITDKAIGSVHYISPEQARGEKTDEKADIYSVGVMLYEMLTGQLPFEADSALSVAIMQLQRDPKLPTQINSSIPLGLEQITMKAMQKSLDRRYQTAAEMLCDLEMFKKDPAVTFEHTYFVDDEPTKYVSPTPNVAEVPIAVPEKEPAEPQKKKNNIIPILAGVATAFVIAIGVLAIVLFNKFFGSTGEEIDCPDFVGMTQENINSNDEYNKNFKIKWEYESSEKYERGTVCKQSTPKGKKVKAGAKITLWVSTGQTKVNVPDVYGKAESLAVTELNNNKLSPEVKQMSSDTVEKGLVIKTEPEKGKAVAENTKVIVYVSSGKETKNVKVPDFPKNVTKEFVVNELTKIGLNPKPVDFDLTSSDSDVPKGYVVSVSPAPNEVLPEGSDVTVYVSTGKYKYEITLSDLKTSYEDKDSGTLEIISDGVVLASIDVKLKELTDNKVEFSSFTSAKKELSVNVDFAGKRIKSVTVKPGTVNISCQ